MKAFCARLQSRQFPVGLTTNFLSLAWFSPKPAGKGFQRDSITGNMALFGSTPEPM
ncbi:MAG: hypothetical protein QM813_10070 [Verrucomicrobiota bacterium]